MTLSLDLKTPDKITFGEVVCYWDRLQDKTPYELFTLFRSPSRTLLAWLDEEKKVIALMWDRGTGEVHQFQKEAYFSLAKAASESQMVEIQL